MHASTCKRWPRLLMLSLIFFACQKKSGSITEITFWAMGAEGEYISQILPRFHTLHPEIRVKVQSIPWGAAHEKLLTAFAGQSTPDVCQLGNTWIPEFQAIAALLPLDSLIQVSSVISPSAYFEGIWNTNLIGKQVYGIPWYVDTRLLFYRRDLLAEVGFQHPPQTWNEWLTVARKIKQNPATKESRSAVFFSLIFNDWQIPVVLILANGGRLLKDDYCYAAFDDSATIAALDYYLTFFREALAIRNMTEVANIYQAFEDGVFAMMVTGPWNVNELRKRAPELTNRWSTAPMPVKKNGASIAGGSSLVIFKNSQHPGAAWKLIEFLAQPEIQQQFFQLTRDLPAVKSAWNSPALQQDPEIQAFYTQLEQVVATPPIAEWEQIAVKIQEHLEEVVFEKTDLKTAVQRLNREVDQILEKRRWLLSRGLLTPTD